MQKVLITGGTGLIGKKLTALLLNKGYEVSLLSRKANESKTVKTFTWDVEKNIIDPNSLKNVDIIIHLAGEGIADKRWTSERKKSIINSRVNSTQLLFDSLSKIKHQVHSFISASAIGYYGDRNDELLTEESQVGKGFLAESCLQWENTVDKINELNIRVVKLRTGIVLSKDGGALAKMAVPFKFGFGTALGSGKQWMSWIHEEDLCNMYLHAIEHSQLKGSYNAVSPNPVNNKTFSKVLAKVLNRPFFLPNVPAFILKIILGEMSTVVLNSNKVSANKILKEGFHFKYENLEEGLKKIF